MWAFSGKAVPFSGKTTPPEAVYRVDDPRMDTEGGAVLAIMSSVLRHKIVYPVDSQTDVQEKPRSTQRFSIWPRLLHDTAYRAAKVAEKHQKTDRKCSLRCLWRLTNFILRVAGSNP
jgi:hypothetical protein